MRTHGRVRPLVLAIGMVILAGCSSSGSVKSSSPTSGGVTAAPTTTAAPAGLQTASNAKLGAILTDAAGMTLYRNTKEQGGTFACTGGCTSVWPPLLLAAGSSLPAASAGVTGTVATVTRPDGGAQVTYNGAPLYHYAADHQAGDTNGQGVAGIWFVVSPTATSTTTTSPTTAATHTTVAPAHAAPTSPPVTPAPTTPKPSPTTPPTMPKPKPTTPPTMPPTTMCAYPPCY